MPRQRYYNALSDTASVVTERLSIFEDAPESPSSWKFVNALESPLKPRNLEAQLQACHINEAASSQAATEPFLRSFPPLPKPPKTQLKPKRIIETFPARHATVIRHRTPKRPYISRAVSIQLTHSNHQQFELLRRSLLAGRVSQAAVSSYTFASNPLIAPKGTKANENLKIKVLCPSEDEILALKVHRNKIQSIRELTDIVSIKLNVRYCMRPDDIECSLVFSDKSLSFVNLDSGSMNRLLEEYVMEYIETKPKICIEARLKANRPRPGDVSTYE